jgi:LuxR family quorum-sensing system transcriptional regulator CciR
MGLERLSSEFEARAQAVTSDEELGSLLGDAANELGFAHYAIVHSVSFRRDDPGFISIDNYPESWAEEFVGQQLYLDDPVLQASERTAKAFRWTDVARMLALKPRHQAVMEKSARYGMGHGFTVPANVPGEPTGSCSFAMKPGKDLPQDRLRCAEAIGIDAFDAARRLRGLPDIQPVPHLSRRERQCVRLLAAGHNDKQIARHLELSPETVKRYVATARVTYNAVTRTELVTKALRDGQISFAEGLTATPNNWKSGQPGRDEL